MPVIPSHVIDRYIQSFNEDERTQIREAAAEAQKIILGLAKPSASPLMLMTAGSAGSGKTTHLKNQVRILESNGPTVVLLDPTSMLDWMKPYKDIQMHIAECASSNNAMQRDLDTASNRWRNAAKFVTDSLLNACVENSISVAYESTAKTPYIRSLISRAREAGMRVRVDVCEAPYQTKLQSCADRFQTEAEQLRNEREIWHTDTDISGNLSILAEEADELRIYWRSYKNSQPLIIAQSTGLEQAIHQPGLADAFNSFHHRRNSGGLVTLFATHMESVLRRANKRQPTTA